MKLLKQTIDTVRFQFSKPEFPLGAIVENCEYEPAEVVGHHKDAMTQTWSYDTVGVVTGHSMCCGAHCGVKAIKDVEKAKAFFHKISHCKSDEKAYEIIGDYNLENNYVT